METLTRLSPRSILSFFAFIVTTGLTYIHFKWNLIPEMREIVLLEVKEIKFIKSGLVFLHFGQLLISINICLACNCFKALKSWREDGLYFSFMFSHFWSLLWTLNCLLFWPSNENKEFIIFVFIVINVALILFGWLSGIYKEFKTDH